MAGMTVYVIVSIGVCVASFVVLTVYAVRALIQIERMACSWEVLARSLDSEVNKVSDVTGFLSGASGWMRGTVRWAAAFVSGLVGSILDRSQQDNGRRETADQSESKTTADKR